MAAEKAKAEQSEQRQPSIVCAKESLDLLNCVTESPYDETKCIRLLESLRTCVLNQKVKKFSLAEPHLPESSENKK
ncbi:hypothetical protein IFM89_019325 [Coptis chinensis]|uniref:CHCH domain-containing protein n=1 Tax=Coptis chinensis TaxID=261450 RepID=A0A835IF11_9MAGN|nr:hypothetical protein IFM89_019325 [Coptis chinensis]